jgi:adenylate cyclase
MVEKVFKRKLSAILNADVVGYSRLMENNEEETVRMLTTCRNEITDLIQQYRGRLVDSPGDNILSEFTSVVDAANCAVEIQRYLSGKNTDLPVDRKMEVRIGVNLGDVIEDDGRIYGDGVNIAARVQSLADAGGICISGSAYDQIANKLGLEYENLGEYQVKNISTPIRVYRILTSLEADSHRKVQTKENFGKWQKGRKFALLAASAIAVGIIIVGIWQFYLPGPQLEAASVENMAFPLPERPSIAVLPFDNMSGDPGQDYFCDGLTEQIITSLSKYPGVFVISRNSTFFYKGTPVTIKKVAEDLGVQYVLEGSIQRSENRLRITAQLIDALKGVHIWADTYNRDIKELFSLQDELTLNILNAIGFKLTGDGITPSSGIRKVDNLEAVEKALLGIEYLREFNQESNAVSRKYFEEAIAFDQNSSGAYAGLSSTHIMDIWLGSTKSIPDSLTKAYQLSQKAISLDESNHVAHCILGHVYVLSRQYEKAIFHGERAVEICPNCADPYVWLAMNYTYAGDPDESILLIQKALRLSPHPPDYYYFNLALAYSNAEKYENAYPILKKGISRQPDNLLVRQAMVYVCSLSGRDEEARQHAAELLKINPGYSVAVFESALPHKNKERVKILGEALRKAGLK